MDAAVARAASCRGLQSCPIHFRRGAIHSFSPILPARSWRSWLLTTRTSRPMTPILSLHPPPSQYCTVGGSGSSDAGGVGGDKRNAFLNVVLVSPQIAGNTGCIARTCAASAVSLHLVEPLGYKVDDAKLKRAGLDYWPYVVVKIHKSWAEFRAYFLQQDGEKRLLAFTKKGKKIHSDFLYKPGDWLVFGSETSGLPTEALLDCTSESMGGGTIRIPMIETYVRCLNLSVSVGIALYEASRQLNYKHLEEPANVGDAGVERLFVSEDIFA